MIGTYRSRAALLSSTLLKDVNKTKLRMHKNSKCVNKMKTVSVRYLLVSV